MRPTNRILWRWIVATVLLILSKMMHPAHAQEYQPPDLPCIPTVSDYDNTHLVHDGLFAVIWWCEEQQSLASYWWTDTTAKSSPQAVLRLASRDPDEFRRQHAHRWSTVDQITLAMQIQHQQGPRCYAGGAQVSCLSWRMVDGRRMCEVSGRIQADGTQRPGDSWDACELRKAPTQGWQ